MKAHPEVRNFPTLVHILNVLTVPIRRWLGDEVDGQRTFNEICRSFRCFSPNYLRHSPTTPFTFLTLVHLRCLRYRWNGES